MLTAPQERRIAALLFFCAAALSAAAVPPDILVRARDLGHDPAWLTLLHYGGGLAGGHGLVDDRRFWLSPDGAHDPQAELDATLAGLWAGDPAKPEEAVAARFPARTAFLAERLGFARADLPVAGSPELEALLDGLRARRAWLVFPTGYLASPASMFGHTLLLIQGRNESPLLSQSINYAAEVPPGESGPLSMLKGLFGGYSGYFSVLPYHRKVQEYTDLDQRDIWEYELTLAPAELDRLLRHSWELRGIASDYWFLDENCSFNLLFLLDAARPGLTLTSRAGAWVIPGETVRWVHEAGLVAAARYRPSLATRVAAARAGLPGDLAVRIARGGATPAEAATDVPDPALRAQTLDLAGEALHALAGRHAISLDDYRTRLHVTLGARAALGAQPGLPEPAAPAGPERAHPPLRVAAGVGRDDGVDYATLAIRPTQHDLLDPPDGFTEGAALTFAELDLRWYRDGRRPVLNRFDAVRIASLPPYEGIFRRWSWMATAGLRSERMGDDAALRMQAAALGGIGWTAGLPASRAWLFATGDARGFGTGPGYALGPGAQLGITGGGSRLRLLGTAQATRFVAGRRGTAWEVAGGVRYAPWSWGAIDLLGSRYERWERLADAIQVRGVFYLH
jgi:hypothetical protein